MECCYLFKCAEFYCYICASCGVFYHCWDEGELECSTVKNWYSFTTDIIILDALQDIKKD